MTQQMIETYKEFVGLFKYFPTDARLTFVRHGETDNNLNNIIQGGAKTNDTKLNRKGIIQSHDLGKKMDMEVFDFTFTSPSVRTKETFEILRKYFLSQNEQQFELPTLTEFDFGDMDGKLKDDTEYYTLIDSMFANKKTNLSIDGSETLEHMFERCAKSIRAMVKIIAEQFEQKKAELPKDRPLNILITGHGMFIGFLLNILIKRSIGMEYKPNNGDAYTLIIGESGKHKLDAYV
ncbi:histidine phosphatase [Tenacibaculum phage PTm1]|uniref:Histidine phosphatase n=2 Tax=Shirahamavirus PTm1 TaxID=2846435 RepID=A0A5S9BZ50_9CAUD|nr:histidine phosphatase [Tenacibaculum phage PTm1]BBI90558.1 histidine phosphatase [Tenacibaculum phage PTm1]BBI90866.1 histidine phosphatase [Tenacibaculum phage PTm5]